MQLDTQIMHLGILENVLGALVLATDKMNTIAEPGSYAAGVIEGRYQVLSELAQVIGADDLKLPQMTVENVKG